jgi:hypothetical protein
MRALYGSLLPLEGEGEDEGRSKATDSFSDQTPYLNPLPWLRGEAVFAEIE